MTYYVSGDIWIDDITIEGGAVIKYASGVGRINSSGTIVCKTAPYRPAVLTSKNDNTVGEIIAGSTGTPSSNEYYSTGFRLYDAESVRLEHLRFAYIGTGLNNYFGNVEVRNCQFVKCRYPIDAYEAPSTSLRNVLMYDVPGDAISLTRCSASAEHLTMNQGFKLVNGSGSTFAITNSLLTAVQWWGSVPSVEDNVIELSSASGVYQTVGAGKCYLATNSPYRNIGTTNIHPALLADLKKKTTYPPVLLSNVTVDTPTLLTQQATRDVDAPDIGYHYEPLDYLVDRFAITNAALTITNGVAIGAYLNNPGIGLQDGSSIRAVGMPDQPIHFTFYNTVQEQPVFLATVPPTNFTYACLINPYHLGSTLTVGPLGEFRFAKFSSLAATGVPFYHTSTQWDFQSLSMRDCEIGTMYGYNQISVSTNSTTSFVNNLFRRTSFQAMGASGAHLAFSNNLFWGGTNVTLRAGVHGSLLAFNNVFDSCYVSSAAIVGGLLSNNYNAYLNCTGGTVPLTNAGPNNIIQTNTLAYQTGPLGSFYQPTNSPLRDVGSVSNAALAGFNYYTTTTNQVWEAGSVLDLGYHYISVDAATGLPIDSDWDGVPDYLDPDSDGDNLPDAWELAQFGNLNQSAAGDPDQDGLTNLQECGLGTDPQNWDTDGDGLSDAEELDIPVDAESPALGFLDPLNPDTGDLGMTDGDKDSDRDSLSNLGELESYFSDPTDPHYFSAAKKDGEFLFTATANESALNSYPLLIAEENAGPGRIRITVNSYPHANYDLYFVNNFIPANWTWRRISSFTCDSVGHAVLIVDQPDPYMGQFKILDANDTDGDGLSDGYEAWFTYNGKRTTVEVRDTDRDGMLDGWEVAYGLDPTDATGANGQTGNPDADAYSNLQEYTQNLTFNSPAHDPRKKLGVEMQRPVVSISSNDSTAERPQGTATFTITRSVGSGGSLANPLTVYYSVGGQIRYGTDFTLTPAPTDWPRIMSAVIPANQSSVTVTLTPTTITLDGTGPSSVAVKLTPHGVSSVPPVADPLQWEYVVNVFQQAVALNVINQLPGLNGPVYAVKMYQTVVYIPGNPPQCGEFHQLIVGGQFTMAGSTPVNNIARLNLATGTWEPMGTGVNGPVHAIEAVERFAGDTSPDIYVGGGFTTPAVGIAKWSGANNTWSVMGSGLNSQAYLQPSLCRANAIRKVEDELWVGGRFSSAGGVASPNLAKWSLATSQWQGLGGIVTNCDNTITTGFGLNSHTIMVTAIAPDGGAIGVSRNGVSCPWCPVAPASIEAYYTVYENGSILRARCRSVTAAGVRAVLGNLAGTDQIIAPVWGTDYEYLWGNYGGLGQFNGTGWELLGYGGPALPPLGGNPWWPVLGSFPSGWKPIGSVNALTTYDGDIYVGGSFNTLSGAYPGDPPNHVTDHSPFNNLFKWNAGTGWSTLANGSGFPCAAPGALGVNGPVYAMDVEYSLCNGEFMGLWVGGNFTQAGGGAAWRVACWKPSGYWDARPAPAITSPANGAVLLPPANVTLSAGFAVTGCGIVGVEFYEGSTRLGALTSEPYDLAWNNVPVGTHTVTAVSTDGDGRVAVSEPVTFRVDALPTVSITSPASGATFNSPANITINATATDSDGTVRRVDFYANGVLIGTDTTSPYSKVWSSVPAGDYTLTVKATDNDGGEMLSAGRTIKVN